jgi:hypothetical protein
VLLQLSPCCTHTFCAFLPHPYILALFLLTFFDHVPTQMSRVDKSMSSVSTLQAEAGRVLGEFSEKQERSLHGTYPASVIPRHFILMICWVRSVKRLGSHAYVPSFGHTSPFHPNDFLGAFSKAPRLSCSHACTCFSFSYMPVCAANSTFFVSWTSWGILVSCCPLRLIYKEMFPNMKWAWFACLCYNSLSKGQTLTLM